MAVFNINMETGHGEKNIIIGNSNRLIQKNLFLLRLGGREVIFRKAVSKKDGEINLDKYNTIEELEILKWEIIKKRVLVDERRRTLKRKIEFTKIFDPFTYIQIEEKKTEMKEAEMLIKYFTEQYERVEGKIQKLMGCE